MVKTYKCEPTSFGFKLLRKRELLQDIPIGESTLYDEISRENFPRPIKVGRRASAWIKSEVDTWLAQKTSQRKLNTK